MLNIKDPRAHELARELAAADGTSLTAAVIRALEERLRSISDAESMNARRARIRELQATIAEHADSGPWIDHDELLYDPETGLPR